MTGQTECERNWGQANEQVTPEDAVKGACIKPQEKCNYHTEVISPGFKVIIPPNEVRSFNDLSLNVRLLSDDIRSQIRDESKTPTCERELHKIGELLDLSWYDSYHAYDDHLQYLDDLVADFPKNFRKYNFSSSYENRTIYAFHLFSDTGFKGDSPSFYGIPLSMRENGLQHCYS